MDNAYQYDANISLNKKLIDATFFKGSEKLIWSSNYAANFRVVKINKLYIIISSVAKQNNGDYVLIIDGDSKFVQSFYDVKINVDKENKTFSATECSSTAVDSECYTQNYSVLENTIEYNGRR